MADDLGYADLGCYGGAAIATPHLDRLAAEGLRFRHAYSGSTVCAPSRCALMTGFHSGHGYIRGNTMTPPEGQMPLPEGTVTLATLLKRAGYATGAFGKWGLGGPDSTGQPSRQGFDEFLGYLCQARAHDYYPKSLRRHSAEFPLDGKTYSHDVIFREALSFIERHRERPFFLYLPVTLPHGALDVPDAGAYASKPWPQPVRNYAAMVSLLDRDVGRLMDLLARLRLDDNTIVFFCSDNGAEIFYFRPVKNSPDLIPDYVRHLHSSGPMRGFKRDVYEGGIRVPLIARWPGRIRPGVTDHVCAFWDVLPTFADLIGAPPPRPTDGISFAPTLLGERRRQPKHRHLYWEFHERGFSQAVRFDDWKAVRRGPAEPIELYDLHADPGERQDIARRHPALVEKARALMQTSRTESSLFPVNARTTPGSGYDREGAKL
jgi:arylsulfatase A